MIFIFACPVLMASRGEPWRLAIAKYISWRERVVAVRRDEVADQFLGFSELVAVRRVDKVAAGFDVTIENLFLLPLAPRRAPNASSETRNPVRRRKILYFMPFLNS
jgi:hypothetical protein